MAVVIWNSSPVWNRQLYEETAKRVFGGTMTPSELPDGAIAHIAMARPESGWQVLEIWESEPAYQAFLQERVIPAAQEIGAPPFDSQVIPAHNVVVR